MRLYNVKEPDIKVIDAEDYSLFASLLNNKMLSVMLYVYTAYVVIASVCELLGGMYVTGGINIIIRGLICAALWMFKLAPKSTDKLSTKGSKMFQIAHAVKYFIVFVLLIIFLILLILTWIRNGNLAKQELTAAKAQTDAEVLAAAKHNSSKTFWTYFGLLIGYLASSIIYLVYYRMVMGIADGYIKYSEKGTHFLDEIKFFGIYGIASAVILVAYSVLSIFLFDKIYGLITSSSLGIIINGNILVLIPNFILAIILVLLALQALKAHKILSTTDTTYKVTIDANTHEILRNATEEDLQIVKDYEEELRKALSEEDEEVFVSNELMYDEDTIKQE